MFVAVWSRIQMMVPIPWKHHVQQATARGKYMHVRPLNRNEKLVLYGLTEYPLLADQEICNIIDLKPSTFSTLKKKLFNEGYYRSSYDPILQHLGFEIVAIWYAKLNRSTKPKERLAITRKEFMDSNELIVVLSESNQMILVSISKNISDHMAVFDRIVQLYEYHDFLEGEMQCVLFPFEQSAIFTFFDFSALIDRLYKFRYPQHDLLELNINSPKIRCRVEHKDLTPLQKKVFLGLIRHPDLSDSSMAEEIGCSRQAIRTFRNQFIEEKLIKKRRIVNLEKLGFQILAMTHSKFNPHRPLNERKLCIQTIGRLQTPIFNIARDRESVMFTPFLNFKTYQANQEAVLSFCTEKQSLKEEPATILMSIPRIHEVKWLIYEPLVRKALQL